MTQINSIQEAVVVNNSKANNTEQERPRVDQNKVNQSNQKATTSASPDQLKKLLDKYSK